MLPGPVAAGTAPGSPTALLDAAGTDAPAQPHPAPPKPPTPRVPVVMPGCCEPAARGYCSASGGASVHGLIERVGRDLPRPSSPTPCHEQRQLQLDRAAQSLIQPGLECLQGWGISHLSGQPVPGFHHPQRKDVFLLSSLSVDVSRCCWHREPPAREHQGAPSPDDAVLGMAAALCSGLIAAAP